MNIIDSNRIVLRCNDTGYMRTMIIAVGIVILLLSRYRAGSTFHIK